MSVIRAGFGQVPCCCAENRWGGEAGEQGTSSPVGEGGGWPIGGGQAVRFLIRVNRTGRMRFGTERGIERRTGVRTNDTVFPGGKHMRGHFSKWKSE